MTKLICTSKTTPLISIEVFRLEWQNLREAFYKKELIKWQSNFNLNNYNLTLFRSFTKQKSRNGALIL
jgi:hypothetical protein